MSRAFPGILYILTAQLHFISSTGMNYQLLWWFTYLFAHKVTYCMCLVWNASLLLIHFSVKPPWLVFTVWSYLQFKNDSKHFINVRSALKRDEHLQMCAAVKTRLMKLVPIYDSFAYSMKQSHLSCTANNAVRIVYVSLEMCMKPSLGQQYRSITNIYFQLVYLMAAFVDVALSVAAKL